MDSIDWTAIAIVVYGATAVGVAFHAFVLRGASLFEPIGQYLIFVSLFALPLPIRACLTLEIEGNVTPQLPALLPYLAPSLLLVAASLPAFSIAYIGRWARRTAAALPIPQPGRRDRSWVAFLVLAGLSSFLVYLLTRDAGGILPFLLLGYGSTEETFGRGYLAIGFPWLFVAALFLLHRFGRRRDTKSLLAFVLALGVVLVVQLLTGNRAMLVYMLLVVLIFVHHAIRPIGWKLLLPIGLAGFVFLNLLGAMRASNYASIDDFIERTTTTAERVTEEDSQSFFYTLTIGQFVVPFETLPQMVRRIGVSELPWMGWSYLRTPLYAVPGALFPHRPLPLANWYMEQYYGGGYGLNEGRQFFFLSEAYLNFGALGIVGLGLFWGWLWGALHAWMMRCRGDPSAALIYALSLGYMFRCIAGDFSTLAIGLTQQSLVAALLGLYVAGVGWRGRRPTAAGTRQGA